MLFTVNQWEERRKKAALRGFYKQIDKDQQQNVKKSFASKVDDQKEHEYVFKVYVKNKFKSSY